MFSGPGFDCNVVVSDMEFDKKCILELSLAPIMGTKEFQQAGFISDNYSFDIKEPS